MNDIILFFPFCSLVFCPRIYLGKPSLSEHRPASLSYLQGCVPWCGSITPHRAQGTPSRHVNRRKGDDSAGTSLPPLQPGRPSGPSRQSQERVLTQSTCRTTAPCLLSSLVKMSSGNSCRARERREKSSSVQTTFAVLEVWDPVSNPHFKMGSMNLGEKK